MNKVKSLKKNLFALVLSLSMVVTLVPANTIKTNAATDPVVKNVVYEMDGAYMSSGVITWDAVEGASAYKIYKADSNFAAYELVGETASNSYSGASDDSYYKISAVVDGKESEKSAATSYELQVFGENTHIFEDTDNMDEVQKLLNAAYEYFHPYSGQFVSERVAFMFKPSEKMYNVNAGVGYYTQLAGLGISPKDVNIKQMYCQGLYSGVKYDGGPNYSALCNFWRSVENFSTPATETMWAVSQATAMRRINFEGSERKVERRNNKGQVVSSYTDPTHATLYLHDQGGYASGGFFADSKVATIVESGSQQQWLSRNVETGTKPYTENAWSYNGAVWNNVLVGCKTSIKESNWPNGTSTVVEKTPEIAEKPYLVYDQEKGIYGIAVPKVKENTQGVSWENMTEADYDFIPLADCYVAKPGEKAEDISAKLNTKKALILTPGIYEVDKPIEVNNENTVVLGLGYATIKPTAGNQCMVVGDCDGVRVAGLLFDAGRVESETLLTVGTKGTEVGNAANPVVLSDCFFRVGGADSQVTKTKSCVVVNTNEVITDNFWVWRADHGSQVAWEKNTCDNGVIFNGKNITAYGLMVEHFQKVQTQWNADGGRCYMYQSELPYDITSQSVWNEPGSYGYTDYKVASNVKTHEGYGIGIYSCYQKAQCYLKSGITCPDTEGVKFNNVCTYSLSGNGTIDYAINNAGYIVAGSGDMCKIISYCNGKAVTDNTKRTLKMSNIEISGKKEMFATDFTVKYTGKEIKPTITVMTNKVKLREGIDYSVTITNNKAIGNAKIVVQGLGSYKTSSYTYTMKIRPAKVKVSKKKATKKKVSVKWAKSYGANIYEVRYSTKKNFSKKATTIKTTKKTTFTFKRAKGAKVYVKVRAGKKVGKKFYYSGYSNKLMVK